MSEQGGLQAAREAVWHRLRLWRSAWIVKAEHDEKVSAEELRAFAANADAALDVLVWTAKVEALRTERKAVFRHYKWDNWMVQRLDARLAAAETELQAARQRREAR